MKNIPKVSVIIRCYNQADYIEQAIKSVRTQTYDNLEIVVIDDASGDNSRDIIRSLAKKDKRIKPILNTVNMGAGSGSAKTINIALRECTGKYIANLDGDNFWLSNNKIACQVEWMENNPEYVLVGSMVQNVDNLGKNLNQCEIALTDDEIRKKILKENQFAASSVLFRKEDALTVGGYPEYFSSSIDLGLWLKLGLLGKFYNFSEYWQAHRITGFNIGEIKRKQQLKDALGYIKEHKNNYEGFYLAYLAHIYKIGLYSLPKKLLNILKLMKNRVYYE